VLYVDPHKIVQPRTNFSKHKSRLNFAKFFDKSDFADGPNLLANSKAWDGNATFRWIDTNMGGFATAQQNIDKNSQIWQFITYEVKHLG
jgi:hypothetical protein